MTARAILEEILYGLESSERLTEAAKTEVKTLVAQVGLLYGVGKMNRLDRMERADYAADLIAKNVPRHAIRSRLMARFSISRETAYRVIRGAEKVCQHPLSDGTPDTYTGINQKSYEGQATR